MTSPQPASPDASLPEAMRELRRKRIERGKRRQKIINRVTVLFSIIVLMVVALGLAHTYLVEEPRVEADVTATVEASGGEVIRFSHTPRRPSGPGYVVVVFNGQESRCLLKPLDQDPPAFDCDPAITP